MIGGAVLSYAQESKEPLWRQNPAHDAKALVPHIPSGRRGGSVAEAQTENQADARAGTRLSEGGRSRTWKNFGLCGQAVHPTARPKHRQNPRLRRSGRAACFCCMSPNTSSIAFVRASRGMMGLDIWPACLGRCRWCGGIQVHRALSFLGTEHTITLFIRSPRKRPQPRKVSK